jgi:predicted nucleotide-binding protein (sugar kinase/HSP70/actin superfamily)
MGYGRHVTATRLLSQADLDDIDDALPEPFSLILMGNDRDRKLGIVHAGSQYIASAETSPGFLIELHRADYDVVTPEMIRQLGLEPTTDGPCWLVGLHVW